MKRSGKWLLRNTLASACACSAVIVGAIVVAIAPSLFGTDLAVVFRKRRDMPLDRRQVVHGISPRVSMELYPVIRIPAGP